MEKFVYDPRGSSGSVVVQANRGAFRWVTGSQAKHAYQINTPDGTMGVLGTTVEFLVRPGRRPGEEECVAKVRLVEGEGADYRVKKTGKLARLRYPGQVACVTPAGDVTYSTSSTSILGFELAGQQPPPSTAIPGTIAGVTPPSLPPCVSPTTLNCQQ